MRLPRLAGAALLLVAPLAAALPAQAQAQAQSHGQAQSQALIDRCVASTCVARLTPAQLLAEAQRLVLAGRTEEARPMLQALAHVPALRLETRFLTGIAASAAGDHAAAAEHYSAILADDPSQTRVRLELARAMLAMGKTASADRQFRIAAQDQDLPPDVARTIRAVRDVIRQQRGWRFDVDFALVPDSNINNATDAERINILFGDTPIPLTLDDEARARSGTGQSAVVSAGLRLPVAEGTLMLVDLDSSGTNFSGESYDDYLVQLAAGPEFRLSSAASVSVQAVGAQRWYGGDLVSRQAGVKTGFQARLSDREQIGLQLDARHTEARFDDAYSGWQIGAYATYERAVARAIVVSGGVFGRRDSLGAETYSSTELGVIAGVGGELAHGISFGLSGTVSRAEYDAPMAFFSPDPREDWRYTARATLGNRKIRLLGFSPQLSASYTRTDSSLPYFANDRLRFRIGVARYF
ncbi:surface lipoprotein assembly modifier [Sphingosinithalassobacter sp. LHW66-3]|uniref:surface lipoprotein assembly modifier n=1 Tax=Sphingosinithalassobacter sp. LHW66-3 TaxID=3424718 RepID=UPI003D6A0A40